MPLYEYRCKTCEHTFQRIEKPSPMPTTPPDCPECGGPAMRQLGAPALQFKGTGWYVTDYAKKNGTPATSPSSSSSSSSSSSDSSSDSSSSSSSSSTSESKSSSDSSSSSSEAKPSAA